MNNRSLYTTRTSIGVLGLGFPVVLILSGIFTCGTTLPSISDYYHTDMRPIFVMVMTSISIFLWTYEGYDIFDFMAAKIGAIGGIGLTLFPTKELDDLCVNYIGGYTNHEMHLTFSALFFLATIYFCLFLFVKSDKGSFMGKWKKIRNITYKAAGYTMLGCLVSIGLYLSFRQKGEPEIAPMVLILETIALIAFGTAWTVKGIGSRD